MGHHGILPAYQPLVRSLSERLVRLPLGVWEKALADSLRQALMRSPVDWDALAPILNQLAVIQAYRGHNERALGVCEAQIALWKALAVEAGHEHRLVALTQPWVNIIRLERWQKKVESSIRLYQELAPQNRARAGSLNSRYGVGPTLEELLTLSESGNFQVVLDNVYWIEYTRWLLATGQYPELQAQLQAGLNSRLSDYAHAALLEVLLIYQIQIGAYPAVDKLIARLRSSCSDRFRLPFAVLEFYLRYSCGDAWKGALEEVCRLAQSRRCLEHDKFGLSLLCDIAATLRDFGVSPDTERSFLEQAYPLALEIDDEVSLFEVSCRLAELGHPPPEQWRDRFQQSEYALIRKRIGLPPLTVDLRTVSDLMPAVQRLSALDLDGALESLGAIGPEKEQG